MARKNIRTHSKIKNARKLANANRLHKARLAYMEICALDNRDANAFYELGEINIKLGLYEEAAVCLNASITLNPNKHLSHHNLGEIWSRQGKFGDAVKSFKEALKLNQKYSLTHSSIGFALNKQGDVDSALSHYLEAIKLSPSSHSDYSNLLLYMHNSTRHDAVNLFTEHKKWAEQHSSGITPFTEHTNSKDPEENCE